MTWRVVKIGEKTRTHVLIKWTKEKHGLPRKLGKIISYPWWQLSTSARITSKQACREGWGLGHIWFGTQPLQIRITTCILRCVRTVMSQGTCDIVGANISGFRLWWWLCRAAAETHEIPWNVSHSITSLVVETLNVFQLDSTQINKNVKLLFFSFFFFFVFVFLNSFWIKVLSWHHSLVAASVPRGRQWDLRTLQDINVFSEMRRASAHCRAVLVLHPSLAPVPKCPSVYKKQTGNKKIKETKRKRR